MSYVIAGRKVLNEHLALATFGTTGLIAWAATRGGSSDKKDSSADAKASKPSPPLNASSSDEEAFIKQFLEEAEKGENKRAV